MLNRLAGSMIGFVVLTSAAACSGARAPETGGEGGGPTTVEASSSTLRPMIVLRAGDGFELGDTVAVDMASLTAGQVRVYRGNRETGSMALERLGPVGKGRMVVASARASVYRCRSTGCTVVGYVVQGQEVEVSDFAGRWYRVAIEGKPTGYMRVGDLQLTLARRAAALEVITARTAEYFRSELQGLRSEGQGPLFQSHAVKLEGQLLSFEFYTAVTDGAGLSIVCNAMRGIAEFVHATLGDYPPDYFPAYSAGVYETSAEGVVDDEAMVAGLTGGGGVYCRSPD